KTSHFSSRIDPWLLNQQFFHGYLTREDLPSILRDHGDFLVRCSEIRHIIVQSLSNNEQTHYYLDMNTKFPSIEELLMHHRVHPIIVNQ
ncbi:SH2 domain protein, partial [Necator americanus]